VRHKQTRKQNKPVGESRIAGIVGKLDFMLNAGLALLLFFVCNLQGNSLALAKQLIRIPLA
jgi:hypothetical protein